MNISVGCESPTALVRAWVLVTDGGCERLGGEAQAEGLVEGVPYMFANCFTASSKVGLLAASSSTGLSPAGKISFSRLSRGSRSTI